MVTKDTKIDELLVLAKKLAPELTADRERYVAEISFKAGKKRAVEFIDSYLVTTVHPEGNMHHIDDQEWQSVKLRLLR